MWFALSSANFAVGVLFVLFAMLVIVLGRSDLARVLTGAATAADIPSVVLLVGYGASGVVLLWAGVVVLGDRRRRALAAQIVVTPPALFGAGLVVWTMAEVFASRPAGTFLLLGTIGVIVVAEGLAALSIGALALRAGRRVGEAPSAKTPKGEGPTVEVLERVAARGATLAPFRVALVAYRMGALILALAYVSVGIFPGLFISTTQVAWSRGEILLWPPTLARVLMAVVVVSVVPCLAWLVVHGGRQALKHLCIHRRTVRFPDGLEYAHRVLLQGEDAWVSVPPPNADAVADRLGAWSERLLRAEERLRVVALVLVPVLLVAGVVLIVYEYAR